MSKQNNEDRMTARVSCEEAIRVYYAECNKTGYPFKDDIRDIVWDATDGNVDIIA
jgi:hypothetical protein